VVKINSRANKSIHKRMNEENKEQIDKNKELRNGRNNMMILVMKVEMMLSVCIVGNFILSPLKVG
jgi:hypothetical protein